MPAIGVFALGPVGLATLDDDAFCSALSEIKYRREARNRQRNWVTVDAVAGGFDVIRGIVVLAAGPLGGGFREVEKAVETNGRTPQQEEKSSDT